MLNISQAQMGQFGAYARERFVVGMVRHLRQKFPDRAAGVSDDTLRALVHSGIRQAEAHDVVFEDDIRRFLEYLVIYGSPLDERPQAPWLGRILHRDDIDGAAKLDLIGEHELALLRGQT